MRIISNTNHWFIEQCKSFSDRYAIITSEENLTYDEFKNKIISYSNFLIKNSIKENDHVGILFSHRYEFYILINSIWLIGAIPIPLNTKNNIDEINYQIHKADIDFIIVDDNFSNMIFLKPKIIFSKNEFEEGNFNNDKLPYNYPIFNLNKTALILFTSGSTSKPKAVVHSFINLFNHVSSVEKEFKLSLDDKWLASLPLYHIGGFMILIRAMLTGSSVIFPKSLKHEDIKESLNNSPTFSSFVSTTMKRFLEENYTLPKTLRYIFLGGGPIENDLAIRCMSKNYPIVKVYGSTETCSMITSLIPTEKNYDSVGKPIDASTIIKINKYEEKNFGEILVKSNSLFTEYYNDEKYTSEKIINGFYKTGDIGFMDENGYLFILNRREDIIISGGENVSRIEVENALSQIPQIKDVYVFGLQDETWGQIVTAAIVGDNISQDEIKSKLREKLAVYKIPKKYFFIDKLPKNELGKVIKNELLKKLNLSVD